MLTRLDSYQPLTSWKILALSPTSLVLATPEKHPPWSLNWISVRPLTPYRGTHWSGSFVVRASQINSVHGLTTFLLPVTVQSCSMGFWATISIGKAGSEGIRYHLTYFSSSPISSNKWFSRTATSSTLATLCSLTFRLPLCSTPMTLWSSLGHPPTLPHNSKKS